VTKPFEYLGCPLTSNNINTFAKSNYYDDFSIFGGHLEGHLKFLKTLKSAKPAPTEILKSNVSPLIKYQNIYYTLPCHVRLNTLNIFKTKIFGFFCSVLISEFNHIYNIILMMGKLHEANKE